MYSKDQQRWRYYDFIAKKQCVVPENIHTPTTEDSLICTPPSPWVFRFSTSLWWKRDEDKVSITLLYKINAS